MLWIDEMEKAIASGEGDSGVSRRVLGTFLTWLAEQRARIFVVATCNDISALPPELVRKGRFDEIFFVDLPKRGGARGHPRDSREASGTSRSPRRSSRRSPRAAKAISGAELEQAIVAALYTAHSRKQPMSAALIAARAAATQPLVRCHGRADRRAARVGARPHGSCD